MIDMKKENFMKRTLILSLLVFVIAAGFRSEPPLNTWKIDHSHARLGFAISHMMVSEVEGSFKILEATISAPGEDFTGASVYLTADVRSVDTENKDRDEHLKKPDFFDAEKYPVIAFKSSSITKTANDAYEVKGDLTMHGITKPVVLQATAKTGFNPMLKKQIAGFKITGTVKRSDFKISPDTPSAMLGDDVQVVANAEFTRE
jgi:polyisoprenoid-binding protein YceI